nr:alpha-glucosidase C-terminal domain-containing protein [Pyrinomonadaceae bacterium]
LANSDERRILSYLRRSGDEEFLIAINFSNQSFTGFVEAAGGATFVDVTPELAAPPPAAQRPAKGRTNALPALTLGGHGFRIFRRRIS